MNTRKRTKTRKHTMPLLSALTTSMLCANLMATVSAHGAYQKYDTEGWSQPVISVLMQGLAHRETPWGIGSPKSSSLMADSSTSTGEMPGALAGRPGSVAPDGSLTGQPGSGAMGSSQSGQDGSLAADGSQAGQGGSATTGHSQNGQDSSPAAGNSQSSQSSSPAGQGGSPAIGDSQGSQSGSPTGQDGSPIADSPLAGQDGSLASGSQAGTDTSESQGEPKQYAFTEVAQDYFDDALLIGDSRAAGVKLYSGWDNLTYYAENGMTIYNMFQSKAAEVDGKAVTVEEGLQNRSFGKIYLEIGINEMGTGTVDSFMEAYESAVGHLRELQPDAIIYVCGIMYVKQSKSESDPIFNNPNIQARNDRIAGLADGQDIFYLDINEVVTDETGNLNPAYTWDEVHLLGKYDMMWLDYFCSHGIVKDAAP